MLRISRMEKRTNTSVQQQVKTTTSLVNRVRRNKLNYFGHVMRSEEKRKIKMAGWYNRRYWSVSAGAEKATKYHIKWRTRVMTVTW
jgi:hypothetical protein